MKATLHVDFLAGPNDGSQGYARLELEIPFTPSMDIEFEQEVWHEGRKPVSISYNTESQSFFLMMPPEKLPTPDRCKQEKESYKGHGWEIDTFQSKH